MHLKSCNFERKLELISHDEISTKEQTVLKSTIDALERKNIRT